MEGSELLAEPTWRQSDPAPGSPLQRRDQLVIQQSTEICLLERPLGDGERMSNAFLGLDHEHLHGRVEFEVVAVLTTMEFAPKKFAGKLEFLLIERRLYPGPSIHHDEGRLH